MPPPINFSKDKILSEAFEIVRKKGLRALTARKIAQKLQCSTQPIYSAFQSMKELEAAVIEQAKRYARDYLLQEGESEEPFLNIGLRYFRFAQEEKELFELLYLSGRIMGDFVNRGAPLEMFLTRMKEDPHLQKLSDASLTRIGTNMWIYTHGLISLTYGSPF